jgi:hypothetical protein
MENGEDGLDERGELVNGEESAENRESVRQKCPGELNMTVSGLLG